MKNNMELWEAVKRPPEDALKNIRGGRLKGMTDISPQWRYEALTKAFGPCGFGWKYEIKKLWTETGSQDQVMAFAEISMQIKRDDLWSEPIPGIGGAALIAKESNGLYSSDEAFKMAVTDALSVATKMLGVAADIYAGKWDGSKYKDTIKESTLSLDQQTHINDLLKEAGVTDVKPFCNIYSADKLEEIPEAAYVNAVNRLKKRIESMKKEQMEDIPQ